VSTPRRWAGLAVLCASLLVVVMDMTILSLALPAIAADLRPGAVEQLWMVDVYALVLAGLLVTASALGDRWGRRRMLVVGFATFAIASLAVLVVDSPAGVIAVRALLGVGGAMIMPSTLSMVRALFADPRERATALGWWGATAAVGAALGPIIGGTLLEAFSWHSAFLVNVPVMAVAIVAALLLLPESRSDRPGTLDPLATVLSVVGMVALVYAVKHTGEHGIDAKGIVSAVVAVVGLTLFVRRCLAQPDPVLEVRLFRSRSFTAGVLTALCSSIASIAALLLLSQWLQLVRGWSPLESGLALLPMAAAGVICSPLAPTLAARIGARPVLAGGLAVGGIGFLLVFVLPEPISYAGVAVALFLVGAGSGSLAVASAAIMSGAPASKAGSAAAIEESSYELGGVLGVAVLGSLAAAIYRADLPVSALRADGLDGAAADVVRDSLGGAVEVAGGAGPGGADLLARATDAFTHSLAWAGLAGGLVMLAASAVVWWLAPRDLDVSAGH
jgi:DHA2 family multidrug resistance protein-like MFS transporter